MDHALKFHLLDYVVEDFRAFSTLSALDALMFEHYNVPIKHADRWNSRRKDICNREAVRMVGCIEYG